ncbi:hypothetical protein PsorP6_005122 [Peronosclerospora sorghi]|uniref:Uncharacterized protein n=1 Tax=Peronosclerospora sorghi TaxID=230839 RepID=A0ACC0W534_9STRA|nr:hypothetical protein PsorP6_005122 [Peronosclerospora sorghi]
MFAGLVLSAMGVEEDTEGEKEALEGEAEERELVQLVPSYVADQQFQTPMDPCAWNWHRGGVLESPWGDRGRGLCLDPARGLENRPETGHTDYPRESSVGVAADAHGALGCT